MWISVRNNSGLRLHVAPLPSKRPRASNPINCPPPQGRNKFFVFARIRSRMHVVEQVGSGTVSQKRSTAISTDRRPHDGLRAGLAPNQIRPIWTRRVTSDHAVPLHVRRQPKRAFGQPSTLHLHRGRQTAGRRTLWLSTRPRRAKRLGLLQSWWTRRPAIAPQEASGRRQGRFARGSRGWTPQGHEAPWRRRDALGRPCSRGSVSVVGSGSSSLPVDGSA